MLNEKIKSLRKANNMTQEDLAEKICVSRQAITKWESGAGTPDISNIEAIASLFGLTIDELLTDEPFSAKDNLSRTEFDAFGKDDFDIDFGDVNTLDVTLTASEKVIIEIRCDVAEPVYKFAKVRLDNGKKANLAVVQIKADKKYVLTETGKTFSAQDARNHLFIKISLPEELAGRIELCGNAKKLVIHDFNTEKHIEFDGKVETVEVTDCKGRFELTSNVDMQVTYDGSLTQFDINQWKCLCNLYIVKGAEVDVYNKGRGCNVVFDGYENRPESDKKVEYNGYKSEMTVKKLSQ